MLPDAAALRRTYEKLSDDKLLRLATERAGTLRPEALTLLRQIVTERGLADAAMAAIDAQVQVLDDTTLLAYCEVLRALPCPASLERNSSVRARCVRRGGNLPNALITSEVRSFVALTTSAKKLRWLITRLQ
ncbi:MAG: hypothetical protein EOO56_28615 [Hymenobacter sp.]|nr:MAG: hypothetical protein EOO56_28615 [Hymenobacter sp.]